MKIKILIIVLLNLFSVSIFAQQEEEPPVKDLQFNQRLVYGGGFGMQFGNVTLLDLSPSIGYRVSDQLTLGTGISYKYNHNCGKCQIKSSSVFSCYIPDNTRDSNKDQKIKNH